MSEMEENAEQAEETASEAQPEDETGSSSEASSEAPTEAQPSAEEVEDRRRAYRLNKVLGATLINESGDSKTTRLFIIDISESGFKATDHQPLGEGSFEISIVLNKGEDPFVSKMEVVWVKELTVSGMFQMGCKFSETAPEQAQRLKDFIDAEQNKSLAPTKGISIKNPWTMIS